MKKAYFLSIFELEVLDFYETYNDNGTPCRCARCYVKELGLIDNFLLDSIEIR